MNILEQYKDSILDGSISNATIRIGRFGVVGAVFDKSITVPISHFQKIGRRKSKEYGVMVVLSNLEIDSIHSSISQNQFEVGNTVIEILSLT